MNNNLDGMSMDIEQTESLTSEMIEELCDYVPAKLIVGKNCLSDATAMANAHYICQDRNIEIKLV